MHNKTMEKTNSEYLQETLDRPSVVRGALRDEIKQHLLVDIFRGDLPAGTRLVVQKLAVRFGVSSTPIRETLVELEAAGVVEFLHNRGVVVRPFGPDELRQICQIRRILEVEAVRGACGRLDDGNLEEIRLEMVRLRDTVPRDERWSVETLAADQRFHGLIVTTCGSRRLIDEIARYDVLAQSLARVVGNQREVQTRGIFEHLILIDRLKENDIEAAADEMARHINHTARDLERIYFEASTGETSIDEISSSN